MRRGQEDRDSTAVSTASGPGEGPLAGIAFQRALEERAYAAGGGGFIAPADAAVRSWAR